MTPQQIEALKLALEALEGFYEYGYDRQECFEHITAIKEALAGHAMRETQRLGQETEQEPVELCQYGQEPASCTSNPMHCQCAIDAALAQPEQVIQSYSGKHNLEQEPVAWMDADGNVSDNNDHKCFPIPLYTTPPQRTWVGLTKEEIAEFDAWHDNREEEVGWCNPSEIVAYIDAILKEKNGYTEEKNT